MWKIFGFLVGFCSLLIIILWVFQTMFLGKMYEDIRRKEIEDAIELVEKHIDDNDLEQTILNLANNYEIIVTPEMNFSTPRGLMLRQSITETHEFKRSDGRSITFVFYATISPVNATISTIKTQLYYITGIMLVLAVILAFILARFIAKPIEKLNSSAKVLAEGTYDIHFSGKGYREIHELSDTLNYTTQELSKVENLRRELMANISHDLRTPLALIYSHAEMMHDFPDEITSEQTQLIMDEVARLSSLVQDILSVSQLEVGTLELHNQSFNLTQTILEIVNRMTVFVEKEGYQIHYNYEIPVYVVGDKNKIIQVIYNLLTNAVHYSRTNRHICINQIVEGETVRIEIIDKGEGIAPEDIPYIWDRYYRVDKNHVRTIVGTGLGLSIVKKILELHEAEFGVISEKDSGSTFWFSLKIANIYE